MKSLKKNTFAITVNDLCTPDDTTVRHRELFNNSLCVWNILLFLILFKAFAGLCSTLPYPPYTFSRIEVSFIF